MKLFFGLIAGIFISCSLIAQTTLSLQPDSKSGCDASLGFHTNFNSGRNYGSDVYIKAFCMPGASGGHNTNRALIKFDLTQIPNGAKIVSAKLTLYAAGFVNDKLPGHYGKNEATLNRVTSPWTESGVKWNTMPTFTKVNAVTLPKSSNSKQDYTCDVTAMVKDMINVPGANYGFYLALTRENPSSSAALVFCSSDHPDVKRHPKLVIVYEVLPVNQPVIKADSSSAGKSTTPVTPVKKTVVKADQDSSGGTLIIRTGELSNAVISIYESTGKLAKTINFTGTHSTYSVPIGDLSPGNYKIEIVSDTEKGSLKFIKDK
ncbi:MAG: hypothetical protein RL007_618 [Bacteroidota bacterium]|jgi:hypothetical protein